MPICAIDSARGFQAFRCPFCAGVAKFDCTSRQLRLRLTPLSRRNHALIFFYHRGRYRSCCSSKPTSHPSPRAPGCRVYHAFIPAHATKKKLYIQMKRTRFLFGLFLNENVVNKYMSTYALSSLLSRSLYRTRSVMIR